MQSLTILGSTGSIGTQTLEVVQASVGQFKIHALVADKHIDKIEEQVRLFRPALAVLFDERAAKKLRARVSDLPVTVEYGMAGMLRAVTEPSVDIVVTAVSGRIGLEPTLAALQAGKKIALANKETLVAAGELVMETARATGSPILPVDSEHSAVFQCLEDDQGTVERLILTASGGPFFGRSVTELAVVTPEQALRHPNWNMGAKITIDSATMMNKGLEVIEAHHLFGISYDQIDVLIHPQSIIHSLVEYRDGSVLAQLGQPDMRIPIQYALTYPARRSNSFERLDLQGKTLTFLAPDPENFPALPLAYWAGKQGGTMPAVLNAANEVAVHAFLCREIGYPAIQRIVEAVCADHKVSEHPDLATILAADTWARRRAEELKGGKL